MKTFKLSEESVKALHKGADAEGRAILEELVGKEYFRTRPVGVWCLTADGHGCAAKDWDELREYLGGGKSNGSTGENVGSSNGACCDVTPQGVYVVTEETEFVIYPEASAALQWGSEKVQLPDICRDQQTMDFKSCTDAIIEAHKGSEYDSDYGKAFKVLGAPAAEWCRSCSLGSIHTWYLPTFAMLRLIQKNVEAINECLRAMSRQPLTPSYHTTCTEYSASCAYVVDMDGGTVSGSDKDYDDVVRPVSAFQIEDFKLLTF